MQRFLAGLVTVLTTSILGAQSPPFVIVNAASYGPSISPDSLATIFGTNLSITTAAGVVDSNGQLPTELAGTRVQIAGVAAQLFYVSPGQINLVIPAGILPGTVDVVVQSVAGGTSKTATALVATAAPGVFTSDASGTGPGAILNAVTYAPAPFLVQTPANGSDTRTRLAVYGTGFRHAETVTASAQDRAGDRYQVEYVGAAPGFIGLDQINLLIPPDLDGAGTVTLLLHADNANANPVTFQVATLPPSALQLTTLTVSPSFVSAGDSVVATVGLTGVARSGGFPVGLRSSIAQAQVTTPQVLIPEGKASAQATINALSVSTPLTATIIAQAGTVSLTAPLEIDPATTVQLANLSIPPAAILGGRSLTGTVNLTGNAPPGGVNVSISSDLDVVKPQSFVAVGAGKSSADFPIATSAVTQPQTANLTATLGRTSATARVNLLPPMQLSLDATTVAGGTSVTGTVTLGEQAPIAGAIVSFQSSDGTVARPPQSVSIPTGQTAQTFTITTVQVATSRVVTITATYSGFKQTASLTVGPQAASTLSSLTITPTSVTGGNPAQGTVTLTAPATVATTVTLFTASSAASVPGTVIVPQGQTSAIFPITTFRVPIATPVTITASLPGVSKSATLTVQ